MNNLGLSSNGNPFQLVPPNQQNNLIRNEADLTRTGIIIADIYGKISEINKANPSVDVD